jgi:hypothetical protein
MFLAEAILSDLIEQAKADGHTLAADELIRMRREYLRAQESRTPPVTSSRQTVGEPQIRPCKRKHP